MQQAPNILYNKSLEAHTLHLQALVKKRNRLGWARLGTVIFIFVISIQAFAWGIVPGIGMLVIGMAVFLYLVSVDVTNNGKIAHVQRLQHLVSEEMEVLHENYLHRFDGALFQPQQHPFASDLDIFGKASLYQYLNRCISDQGRALLAENLLTGLQADASLLRHEAAKELAPQLEWRHHIQALLLQTPLTQKTEQKTESWLTEAETHFTHPFWPVVVLVYSVITLASAVAALLGIIPAALFSLLFVIYLIVATAFSRKATTAYTQLNGIVKEISTLQGALQEIETKRFNAFLLISLQKKASAGMQGGYEEIKKLKAVLNRSDMRLNVYVFLFLNSFLLWDVRQMITLNKWRKQNKTQVAKWFRVIAELEVLNSIAALHFNKPQWTWPHFSQTHFFLQGRGVGHPLIKENKRVLNDFQLQGTAKVALITGSNMAGKSTFLRSLGVNVVLAQIGAPVCALEFFMSPVQVMSSMRIADNLAENTSTFYAELKKLKSIIEAVKEGRPLLILLDEVLRGTNSLDRHIGSEALVRQLIREGAVALMATHDVEIAKLEKTYPHAIQNYHFDVQVSGEELFFDYKLKPGVCKTLNASLLMKKIGIEMEQS